MFDFSILRVWWVAYLYTLFCTMLSILVLWCTGFDGDLVWTSLAVIMGLNLFTLWDVFQCSRGTPEWYMYWVWRREIRRYSCEFSHCDYVGYYLRYHEPVKCPGCGTPQWAEFQQGVTMEELFGEDA